MSVQQIVVCVIGVCCFLAFVNSLRLITNAARKLFADGAAEARGLFGVIPTAGSVSINLVVLLVSAWWLFKTVSFFR
jgi:hypothetical protein